MASKHRAQSKKEVGSLYSRLEGADLSTCYYCGDPRESLDHVPPLSIAVALDLKEFFKRKGKLRLVPCCAQCNSMLGAKRLGTVSERINYLWAAYSRLVEKTDNRWTADELEEMGPGLRNVIASGMRKTKEYVRKLRGVERRLLMLSDENE